VTHYDADGRASSPHVGGFGFVAPSPAPEDIVGDAAAIVTWGEIAGTPLLLDTSDIKGA
jgi:hypothetical protein